MSETKILKRVVRAYQKADTVQDRNRVIQEFADSRKHTDFHGASMLIRRASAKATKFRIATILLSVLAAILLLALAIIYFPSSTSQEIKLEEWEVPITLSRDSNGYKLEIPFEGMLIRTPDVLFNNDLLSKDEMKLSIEEGNMVYTFPYQAGRVMAFLRIRDAHFGELAIGEVVTKPIVEDIYPLAYISAHGFAPDAANGDYTLHNTWNITMPIEAVYFLMVDGEEIYPPETVKKTSYTKTLQFVLPLEFTSIELVIDECIYIFSTPFPRGLTDSELSLPIGERWFINNLDILKVETFYE